MVNSILRALTSLVKGKEQTPCKYSNEVVELAKAIRDNAGGGSSVSDITLGLKKNTDNDPVIELSYEEDGSIKTSPVSFDKDDFDLVNNHITILAKSRVNYSADEHIIGTWIDGSVLYEKTIDIGNLPNASVKHVNHNITGINRILEIRGCAYLDSENKDTVSLPYLAISNLNGSMEIAAYKDSLMLKTGTDRSQFRAIVTLRYTKTS